MTRPYLLVAGLALVVALGLAACGGSSNNATSTPTKSAAKPAATTATGTGTKGATGTTASGASTTRTTTSGSSSTGTTSGASSTKTAPSSTQTTTLGSSTTKTTTSGSSSTKTTTSGSSGTATATKSGTGTTSGTSTAGALKLSLTDTAMTPATLTAKKGKITFEITNNGKATHNVAVDVAGKTEKSPKVDPGKTVSWTVTIDTAGSYDLYSNPNGTKESGLTAKLTVS